MNTKHITKSLAAPQKLLWIGLFGLTMGYFEAAVVEYLRRLIYPEGFAFPLKDIPTMLLAIEFGREIASVVMLFAVGWLAGRNLLDRFAGFMYGFGVWDITYYLWLKLFENWPASLATDDLLFLIPLPWVGPVWAPVLVSVALIWAAAVYWRLKDRGTEISLTRAEWMVEISAGALIIWSFLWSASEVIQKQPLPAFPWYLWAVGMASGIIIFQFAARRAARLLLRS